MDDSRCMSVSCQSLDSDEPSHDDVCLVYPPSLKESEVRVVVQRECMKKGIRKDQNRLFSALFVQFCG